MCLYLLDNPSWCMYRDNVESLSDRPMLTLLGSNIHNNPQYTGGHSTDHDMMSQGGPRRWIRHNKGRTSHCRLDTSPRWPHHISQLSRHTTDHRRIGPGVLLITYFNIIKAGFSDLFHKLSLFEMKEAISDSGVPK